MYHIVWLPKNRKRVLRGEVAKRIRELLEECSLVNNWKIDEINGINPRASSGLSVAVNCNNSEASLGELTKKRLKIHTDHVHILIQLRPDVSINKAIQFFKSKSSIMIRKEFPLLEEFYWGDFF